MSIIAFQPVSRHIKQAWSLKEEDEKTEEKAFKKTEEEALKKTEEEEEKDKEDNMNNWLHL